MYVYVIMLLQLQTRKGQSSVSLLVIKITLISVLGVDSAFYIGLFLFTGKGTRVYVPMTSNLVLEHHNHI